MSVVQQQSKKRKFVADGVFYAELNEFLTRTLAEDGYSGVEVRVTPIRTEIVIRATRTREVLGEKGRRIRELSTMVQRRFGFMAMDLTACRCQGQRSVIFAVLIGKLTHIQFRLTSWTSITTTSTLCITPN